MFDAAPKNVYGAIVVSFPTPVPVPVPEAEADGAGPPNVPPARVFDADADDGKPVEASGDDV